MKKYNIVIKGAGVLAIVFGLVTLKSAFSVLFIDGPFRADAGNYVPFVVWFNFIAGFFYIFTGSLLFRMKQKAFTFAALIAGLTLFTYLCFAFHVWTGKPYEMQTVFAMAIRSGFWLIMTLLSHYIIRKSVTKNHLLD